MAIFNKSNQQADYSSNITTIAAGAHVTGKIDIECELHIDGEVDAEINSTGLVKIGRSGVLNSNNLRASRLIVSGKFSGEADCEAVEIIDGGDVQGKLISASLEIDASSLFQGESVRKQLSTASKTTDADKGTSTSKSKQALFADKSAPEAKEALFADKSAPEAKEALFAGKSASEAKN